MNHWLRSTLLRLALTALPLGLVLLQSTPALAQTAPTDPSSTDVDETAIGSGMIPTLGPLASGQSPITWGSDMAYAAEHTGRWLAAAASHGVGANARVGMMLGKGNTFFIKTGDVFGKTIGAYQEIVKWVEMYRQMERAWEFVKNYQLRLNLYRFLPLVDVMAPDEMGGGQAYAVGFLPKDSTGWEARANLLNDNPWKKAPGGMRLVEVRYPHSLNDVLLDSSVWGTETTDEEQFQKMMLSGFYEGVVSAGAWMNGAGLQNNLQDNVANMGPRAFAIRIRALRLNRIAVVQKRRDLLNQAATGMTPMPPGFSPADVLAQIAMCDKEIAELQSKVDAGYLDAQMSDAFWMKQASFANEILSKLENSERRLAIMKLAERYRKYERFWATPDQMDLTPEITGSPKIDNAISVIWQALTLLSKGKIPPPTPVPGGFAAEMQAVLVKSEYRELMVDELRAVRRLLAFRYATDKQAEGGMKTVEAGKASVETMMAKLQVNQARIDQMTRGVAIRDAIIAGGGGWAYNLPSAGPGD